MKTRAEVINGELADTLKGGHQTPAGLISCPPFRVSRIIPFLLGINLGCHSTPPPRTTPPAISIAAHAEDQAVKLSQQQNWPAAARAWQLAADRSSLLNDEGGEAVSLHNLAQAERQLGQNPAAHDHLEQAATRNEKLGRTAEWWRNQIALLQLEARTKNEEMLRARFEKLAPLASQLRDLSLRGMFLNELALWQKSQDELAKSETTFAEAELAFKTANDTLGVATISANRAQLFEQQKAYPAAITSWKAALAKFQSLADPPGIARALAGEGRALLAAHQELSHAEDFLRRAAHNYHTLQDPKQAQATLNLLAQCLAAEGKEKEAESVRQQLQTPTP